MADVRPGPPERRPAPVIDTRPGPPERRPAPVIDTRPGPPEGLRSSDSARALLGAGCRQFVGSGGDLPSAEEAGRACAVAGVYAIDEPGRATEFAAWAQSVDLPVLTIGLGADGGLIGPLTIPGRPGCGHCARQRMRAAAAGIADRRPAADDPAVPEHEPPTAAGGVVPGRVIEEVRRIVAAELAVIADGGPERSRFLDHVEQVDARTGLVSRHRVIALSRCPVCGGAGAAAAGERPTGAADPDRGGDPLAGWVDPLTGVIPGLRAARSPDGRLSSPIVVTAAGVHVIDADDAIQSLPGGWGKGLTAADAVRSAVGEAIERYAASLPDPPRLVWARPSDLSGEYLDPGDFRFYTDAQYSRDGFPFVRFDPAAAHPWVAGRWLGGTREVWVPAVLVFLALTVGPRNVICQGTSNGLAASTDLEDASIRATMELVERDAFMVAWLTRTPGRRVSVDRRLDPDLGGLIDAVIGPAGELEIYVLPSAGGATTAVCLAFGDGQSTPGVAVGLGAHGDPRVAVRQAILEVGQSRPYLGHLLRSGAVRPPADPASVRTMLDHAAFYFPADRASAFDRLRSAREVVALDELDASPGGRSVERLASGLESDGVRVAIVDVTSPDVATGPFRVVRAVSPDLQDISYGHGFDRAPVERIGERVAAAGPPLVHPIW